MRFSLLLFVCALIHFNCIAVDSTHKICSNSKCINNGNNDPSSAIVCNICTAKIITNIDAASILRGVQRKLTSNVETKFEDLNVDVLRLIFDDLDIYDLLNLAKGYPARLFSAVGTIDLRHKYKDYCLYIDDRIDSKTILFDKKFKQVRVSSRKARTILRYFGGAFDYLEVLSPSTMISQFINKYTSNSLKKLKISSTKKDTLNQFTRPFTQLEELSFDVEEIDAAHLKLNETFPEICRLTVESPLEHINFDFTLCAFANLEQLNFDQLVKSNNTQLLNEFFGKNPQIKSIVSCCLTQHLCNAINEHLGNFENLTLTLPEFKIEDGTTVNHLKRFQLSNTRYTLSPTSRTGPMEKLTFPNLESIEVDFSHYFAEIWTPFFRRHQHITCLNVQNIYKRGELVQVMKDLPNLTEITIETRNDVEDAITLEFIAQIIETQQNLEKLNVLGIRLGDDNLNSLHEIYGNDWNIVVENYKRGTHNLINLSFERN